MNTITLNMFKKMSAVHKVLIHKSMQHLEKAAECREDGMKCLNKCAGGIVAAAKKAAGDGEKPMTHEEMAGHLVKAAEHFGAMEDHQELAAHNLNKVASAWGEGFGLPNITGGSIKENSHEEMTEGEVPEDEAGEVYPGKAAKGFVTKGEMEARVNEALMKGKLEGSEKLIETLQRLPAGGPRAKLFALDKSAFGTDEKGADAVSKMMNGVHFDQNDPESVNSAAGKVIANMIGDTLSGGQTFGKKVISDPNFRGAAANARK